MLKEFLHWGGLDGTKALGMVAGGRAGVYHAH